MKKPKTKHKIEEKQDISDGVTSRMTFRVMLGVEVVPEKEQMIEVVDYLNHKHGKEFDELTVFLYLPGMDIGSAAYGIGVRSEKEKEGLKVNEMVLGLYPQWKQAKAS